MCSRCGTKIITDEETGSIKFEMCPHCGISTIKIKFGSIFMKRLRKVASIARKTEIELLEMALKSLENEFYE